VRGGLLSTSARAARLAALVLAPLVATALLAGCRAPRPSLADDNVARGSGNAPAKIASLDPRAVDVSVVATASVPAVAIYDSPTAAQPSRTLPNPIQSGGPLVFLVDQSIAGWHRVLLPVRPNGTTGWVRASDVTLARHNYRIEVRLSEMRLEVYLAGEIVRDYPIGVGKESTPTPGGRYYTTELLQPPTPDSVYGSYAYGLSGYSEVLERFSGGPGQLGIHGTNNPSTIGTQVSSGCIRLRNEDIEDLVSFLPLGVPVTVTP
jgi:lipoprotein-anchoring transpeptidase ErfK/SrfK